MNYRPLAVDLDGTLIHTDMLHESALKVLRDNPLKILYFPYWLSRGKAVLKRYLANHTDFNPSLLPYNVELLDWLKQQRSQGRKLILCTASDHSIATEISEHLGVFDEVIASDGTANLSGHQKAEVLKQRFGDGGFDYVGNSRVDLAVWQYAKRAVVVNASPKLTKEVSAYCEVEKVSPPPDFRFGTWRRLLRVHQWLKNILLFVPIVAAHQLINIDAWLTLIIAFFSFSLCASSVYITNDLLDLDSDRQHPNKRNRPFAAGLIPVWKGFVLAPLLLLSSLVLALQINEIFLAALLTYFVFTTLYSWILKRLILIDCLALALLYTLRVIAGSFAVGMLLSFWMLTFSVFLFLSLAFVKRYAELQLQILNNKTKTHGRDYYTSDASLIQMMGITSGYTSVIVLALYLNSSDVRLLYQAPQYLGGVVPVMIFWVSWMWMQAHRGKMHDDPLVFALKDKTSLLAGFAFAVFLVMGTLGQPW